MLLKAKSILGLLARIASPKPTTRATALLSLVHERKFFRRPFIRKLIAKYLRNKYKIFVSSKCIYGRNFKLKHPVGIVIGSGVNMGNNVTIYQNVTVGARDIGGGANNAYPRIGNNTILFAGSVIVGNITVGNHCTVGANAVVLNDVPDGATVAGVPARIVKKREAQLHETSE